MFIAINWTLPRTYIFGDMSRFVEFTGKTPSILVSGHTGVYLESLALSQLHQQILPNWFDCLNFCQEFWIYFSSCLVSLKIPLVVYYSSFYILPEKRGDFEYYILFIISSMCQLQMNANGKTHRWMCLLYHRYIYLPLLFFELCFVV